VVVPLSPMAYSLGISELSAAVVMPDETNTPDALTTMTVPGV
jgi:hypothetical protein